MLPAEWVDSAQGAGGRSHSGMKVTVRIPLQPVPASRPRVSRWGTYYGKTYKTWMEQAERLVSEAKRPFGGALHVETEIVCARPKTSARLWPRGDNDNYEKAAFDLLTRKGYWYDDDQIVTNKTTKRFALTGEAPHTLITIQHL